VPVLEIGGEWRRESSEHARWLDELFPEKPLYPLEHRETIDEIDHWISDTFLVGIFWGAMGEGDISLRFRAWRLAEVLS